MKTVKTYEDYQEDFQDQGNIEILTKIIEEIKPKIKAHLEKYGLLLDEIEIDDEESICFNDSI